MATCKEFNQHAKHDVAKSATFFRPTNSFCLFCVYHRQTKLPHAVA